MRARIDLVEYKQLDELNRELMLSLQKMLNNGDISENVRKSYYEELPKTTKKVVILED